MARLGERMIHDALTALETWDAQGVRVPRVGVNFSNAELCDPRLVDRVAWELDRFELTPDRLVVEVLETVVAGRSEDVVIRNLAGLARLGCCLDLDDFGTGHASHHLDPPLLHRADQDRPQLRHPHRRGRRAAAHGLGDPHHGRAAGPRHARRGGRDRGRAGDAGAARLRPRAGLRHRPADARDATRWPGSAPGRAARAARRRAGSRRSDRRPGRAARLAALSWPSGPATAPEPPPLSRCRPVSRGVGSTAMVAPRAGASRGWPMRRSI